jgi:signal transduction histidine kinase
MAIELLAGYALITCGLVCWWRGRARRFGMLLAAGGWAWFLLEWDNPGVGSALVFTAGLVLYMAAPPIVAHAVLTYPTASLGRVDRVVLAAAYGGSLGMLGLLPALVFDPSPQGCGECSADLLLVRASTTLYQAFDRAGIYFGLVWSSALLALLVWRVARSTTALRRLITPVVGAGCLYVGAVGAEFTVSVRRGYLSNGPLDRQLWLASAGALMLMALAVAWSWARSRRTRSQLARLVIELAQVPSPGRLGQALARNLGDPELRLAYPLPDGRYVDPSGRPCQPGPTSTALAREGVELAVISHKPGLLADPSLAEEVAQTARLALENERLHAELLAHLADLRASRARVVIAADGERRRLERDLHDGAQQRLVALTLALRVARMRLEAAPDPDPGLITRAQRAEEQLRAALADLRQLAAGIFPAVLADEGLAAAVEALAEEGAARVEIAHLPDRRLDPAIETTAYRVISETLRQQGTQAVTLTAFTRDGLLVLEMEGEQAPTQWGELEDRVGALDGALELALTPGGRTRVRAEIPCVS